MLVGVKQNKNYIKIYLIPSKERPKLNRPTILFIIFLPVWVITNKWPKKIRNPGLYSILVFVYHCDTQTNKQTYGLDFHNPQGCCRLLFNSMSVFLLAQKLNIIYGQPVGLASYFCPCICPIFLIRTVRPPKQHNRETQLVTHLGAVSLAKYFGGCSRPLSSHYLISVCNELFFTNNLGFFVDMH